MADVTPGERWVTIGGRHVLIGSKQHKLLKVRRALTQQFGDAALDIPTTPVKSSNIQSFGYDPQTKRLTVAFKGKGKSPGRSYQYVGVPAKLVSRFRKAGSKGQFFHVNVRDKFPFRRIF